jgi:hypothetical protein
MRCIFHDRLAIETCNFIGTLAIDVHEKDRVPSETRKIVGLIRRRLPHLEKLTVSVLLPFTRSRFVFAPGLAAFRILPPSIVVNFNYTRFFLSIGVDGTFRRRVGMRVRDKPEIETVDSFRAELSLIGRKRKEEQAKRELGDQVCDILEATFELRAPLPLQSLLPTQAGAPQKVRLVNLV